MRFLQMREADLADWANDIGKFRGSRTSPSSSFKLTSCGLRGLGVRLMFLNQGSRSRITGTSRPYLGFGAPYFNTFFLRKQQFILFSPWF